MADVQHHGVALAARNTLRTLDAPLGGVAVIVKPRMILLLAILLVVTATSHAEDGGSWHYRKTADHGDIHGGVPMGISNDQCDNAKDNLTVDWDGAQEDYTCFTGRYQSNRLKPWVDIPDAECSTGDLDQPLHVCMTQPIHYRDSIPTSGAHRPLWAKFGEYTYLPKQRWLHNLEHGCAVFLYHPCADPRETELLKTVARSCLRKHIITPLKELSRKTPFAVLTYGCKLLLPYVDVERIVHFLRERALDAPEEGVVSDGQYSFLLEKPAKIVSDIRDSDICPETDLIKW